MVKGRSGIGSHKHGTSGNVGPSPRYKQGRVREANLEIEEDTKLRRKRAKMSPKFGSVAEALANAKKR